MDLAARLLDLSLRKRAAHELLDRARAGALPGVATGDALAEPAPKPEPAAVERRPPEGFTEERGIHMRRLVLAAGEWPQWGGAAPSGLPFDADGAALLFPGEAPPDPEAIAFIDVETSGVSGGAGTVVFLAGVGRWVRRGAEWTFELSQYLAPDFPDEAEVVRHVLADLEGAAAVCHYNGKCFDVPVLRSRAVMHRLPPRALRLRQLDLLHPSRRLWRAGLGSATLKRVEHGVLGHDRGPDIDGALIPEVFFTAAREGTHPRLGAVLRHNAQDIATLALLLGHATRLAARPFHAEALGCEWEPLAKLHERRGDRALARRLWGEAIARAASSAEEARLRLRYAALLSRERDTDAALLQWDTARRLPLPVSIPAWIALAKHHEHAARNHAEALRLIRGLLRAVEAERDLAAMLGRPDPLLELVWERESPSWERRLSRLERKAAPKPRQ
ncbi:MAG: ribonuclease H-like domain-containing protein [Candidatus Sumerlaeia bacterium]|nr:ribonuclease H-like domain-containing protein [Candidatus Sumerlaeia bacterium]